VLPTCISVVPGTQDIQMSCSDHFEAGTYQVLVSSTLTSTQTPTVVNSVVQFQVDLTTLCMLAEPAAPVDQVYNLSDPEISVIIDEYLPRPACPGTELDTLSLTLTNGDPVPSFLSLDPMTRSVNIVGSDVSEAGVYGVTITSTFGPQVNSAV